jgi:hypothetical protein
MIFWELSREKYKIVEFYTPGQAAQAQGAVNEAAELFFLLKAL